ncbi:MAG TPA: hypothetical protein PLI96_11345 [Halothiobacillus sp.]|nr:hypothetical protein [Halothiobacillus sp.]
MATGQSVPFTPLSTVTIAASTTASTPVSVPGSDSVLVFNASAATAFVSLGATASTASTPVPAGGRQLFSNTSLGNKLSVVLASGTGSVYATAGQGTAY